MQDGDPLLGFSTDRKLQLLLDRRKAWLNLEWKQHATIDMPGSANFLHIVSNNHSYMHRCCTGFCLAYELVGGLFAKMTGDHIRFAATPYPTSHEPPEQFSMRYPEDAYRDFAFDPSQDLIIFVDNDTESEQVS
jgi:hypothetical protein